MDLAEYKLKCLESNIVESRGWVKFIHNPAGLFVSEESAKISGWIGEFQSNYTYEGQKPSKGILFQNPGFCIVCESMCLKQSPYMEGSKSSKTILGVWDPIVDQRDRATTGNTPVTKVLIFFIDSNCKLMHTIPLQLTISGAYGVAFKNKYSDFCKEMFAHPEAIGPKVGSEEHWNKYMQWMNSGSRNGPTNPTLRLYASTFVFRPIFESGTIKNSKGLRNAMKTCNTVGFEVGSKCVVWGRGIPGSDFEKVETAHVQNIGAYDRWLPKAAVASTIEESTIEVTTVEDMDEKFDFE
jgi:hypothetical protein